ncbi:MAG: hypothetical protein UHS41_05480 [Lachnospiraceae bacterium]|nr:hypothetical protein [Lachnospiraceae bacterium]
MKKQIFYCIIGILIIGLGSSICKLGQVGIDPCTAMNNGIALQIHLTLGITMMTVQLILLIFVFFFKKSYIGLGTFINGLFIGYIIDAFTTLLTHFFPAHPSLALQISCMIMGVLFITLGVSLYFTGDLGLSPYDAVGKILSERTPFSYSACRIFTDAACAALAIFLHGPIGFGTIIIACFTGPLIQFWNKNFSQPLFEKDFFCL